MFKKRVITFMLVIVLAFSVLSVAGAAKSPYAIKVNKACSTVTIYEADESGEYTVPVKAMICSTARPGYVTPLGTYKLGTNRYVWREMVDGTYAQYASGFHGNYLFHSICYKRPNNAYVIRDAYNNLGSPASMGCIRLETADAKWIFDNCPVGTKVTIYSDPDDPGPLGKPNRTVDYISEETYNGWDPSDPAEGNPWHLEQLESVEMAKNKTIKAGETAILEAKITPEKAMIFWSSSDPKVASVDNKGKVTAFSSGETEITAKGLNGVSATCTVKVEGELLPYEDLKAGAWYYPEIRKAVENGMFGGVTETKFAPSDNITRGMVVQVLYNMAGKPKAPGSHPFTDIKEDAWYRDAVAWASSKEIVTGITDTTFVPNKYLTRQELAAILWRYTGKMTVNADLSEYSDAGEISEFAKDAMVWANAKGLIQGTDGKLLPTGTASRAETAIILQRAVDNGVLRIIK